MKRALSNFPLILLASDALVILLSFLTAFYLRIVVDTRVSENFTTWREFLVLVVLLLPLWLIAFGSIGLYSKNIYERRLSEFGHLAVGAFVGVLIMIGADFVLEGALFSARLIAVYALVIVFLTLMVSRIFMRWLRTYLFRFSIGSERVMVIGDSPEFKDVLAKLKDTKRTGYRVAAVVSKRVPAESRRIEGANYYTNLIEALAALDVLNVDVIVLTDLYDDPARNQLITNTALAKHIELRVIPTDDNIFGSATRFEIFQTYPMLIAHQTPLVGWGRIVKRMFDVVASVIVLTLASPIMIMVVIANKLSSFKEPVIYKQKRVTKYGQEFEIYKFRTMNSKYANLPMAEALRKLGYVKEAEEAEASGFQIKNDPRVTRVGKLLRRTSIDELPQLVNVVRGHISLVGPRAVIKEELNGFEASLPVLLSVKTGITGLAQVSGRSDLDMHERVQFSVYYAQNWTFWMDVMILFKTVRNVIKGDGASN